MSQTDFRRPDGRWAQTFYVDGKQCFTRAAMFYHGMLGRCRHGGHAQKVQPNYVGCTHSFKNFQEFAEWATTQIGYHAPDAQLDKDLLVRGNQRYGADSSVFLPREVNNALIRRDRDRGPLPIGVYQDSRGRLKSQVQKGNCKLHLGYVHTPEEGFALYKKAKENHLKELAEKHAQNLEPRAIAALQQYAVNITD